MEDLIRATGTGLDVSPLGIVGNSRPVRHFRHTFVPGPSRVLVVVARAGSAAAQRPLPV
jgi:hypothetical protein